MVVLENILKYSHNHKIKGAKMKVLILDGGKKFGSSGGKLNTLLCDVASSELEAKGYEVIRTKIDDGYEVESEVQKLIQSDIIIFQYPGWWMSEPWIVKKYLDEVLTAAAPHLTKSDGRHASDPEHGYGTGEKTAKKKYMISTTWNAPITAFNDKNEFFEGRGCDGVTFAMHKAMEFCGMKALPSFICNDVEKNPKVDEYVNAYRAHIRANF